MKNGATNRKRKSPARGAAGALSRLREIADRDGANVDIPDCDSFADFLEHHAKVVRRDGSTGSFSFQGREPLRVLVGWFDAVLRNTLDGEAVTIDGVEFAPGQLKAASIAVGGGAQWGKTILELNALAYLTAVRFKSTANYLPDGPKVKEIVSQKFRPNVLDLYPWMAQMIQVGKTQNASGKTVNREDSYQVSDGRRMAFGNFCGMHKPPTSITIDAALVDEVDDVPERNLGYISGRMTDSDVAMTAFIGTQRVAGAGQNARLKASSSHVAIYTCPDCGHRQNLEENFPRIIRCEGEHIRPEAGFDRQARYYVGCLECGTELDRDAAEYEARNPEKVKAARLGIRVSQLNISAISISEIVGAWYAAFDDPSGEAMVAFYCDRIAIPNAGAAQPITAEVLQRARLAGLNPRQETAPGEDFGYAMSLGRSGRPRFAGMDMGPRCWLWVDEFLSEAAAPMVWAELIASGQAMKRVTQLMTALNIQCVFFDAGGEPDLTKRLVLSLNGLADYQPPALPRTDLLKSHLVNIGAGCTWNGLSGEWSGIRAAAVLFVAGEARGVEQTVGFTQEGLIYPLIKCQRAESIQTAVNDFLTPDEGVLEFLSAESEPKPIRQLPRARLPQTCIGSGASEATVETHLLNLRKERDTRSGREDWVDGVENHLGLAKVYARLASMIGASDPAPPPMMPTSFGDSRRGRALARKRNRGLEG